jgi:3-deoxy-7-phosphoheptulonate synthase
MMSSLDELLLSAEFIMNRGNTQLMLCERGIRTFETSTSFTLDLCAIPVLKRLTHLPVIVDPSHGTGDARYVPSMAKAAVAAGADGLLIEVHPNPKLALSHGFQALEPQQFADLMEELRIVARAVGRRI